MTQVIDMRRVVLARNIKGILDARLRAVRTYHDHADTLSIAEQIVEFVDGYASIPAPTGRHRRSE